jgi:thiamine transport system substrate-binding protein
MEYSRSLCKPVDSQPAESVSGTKENEMKGKSFVISMLLVGIALAACGPGATPAPGATSGESPVATQAPGGAARTLKVMTHDSFDVSETVVAAFQKLCNCQVQFLKSGDAGLMLNQALLSKDNPLADVIYGVDNTFLSRALAGDILESYPSPALADIRDDLKLDPDFRMLPVDYGDVCLNYDKAWFKDHNLPPPTDLPDLTKPEYKSLTVAENPATSSPGLAFLLATIGRFGESGEYTYLDYWTDLRANDVLVTDGWEDAYYGNFTYASKGDRPIVVSYASSPPAEVYFSEKPLAEAPTGVVVADGSCFRQIEFVGILKGMQNRDLAEQWIDFMLGTTFQEDIPLKMFVFPANTKAVLPEVFVRFALIPEHPVTVDPKAIEANREAWIQAWTRVVLR